MTEVEEWVWLARIRRPQGRKGEVFAEVLTDFPEKFAERRRLWLLREVGATGGAAPCRGGFDLRGGDAGGDGGGDSPGGAGGAGRGRVLH